MRLNNYFLFFFKLYRKDVPFLISNQNGDQGLFIFSNPFKIRTRQISSTLETKLPLSLTGEESGEERGAKLFIFTENSRSTSHNEACISAITINSAWCVHRARKYLLICSPQCTVNTLGPSVLSTCQAHTYALATIRRLLRITFVHFILGLCYTHVKTHSPPPKKRIRLLNKRKFTCQSEHEINLPATL